MPGFARGFDRYGVCCSSDCRIPGHLKFEDNHDAGFAGPRPPGRGN
jgi:hypothetical protein